MNDDEEKLKVEVVVKSSVVSSMDDRLEKLSKHVEKSFRRALERFWNWFQNRNTRARWNGNTGRRFYS